MTGTIVRLVRDKGFGFIKSDDDQTEFFFHRSGVMNDRFDLLREKQVVSFEMDAESPKGPRATNVQPERT